MKDDARIHAMTSKIIEWSADNTCGLIMDVNSILETVEFLCRTQFPGLIPKGMIDDMMQESERGYLVKEGDFLSAYNWYTSNKDK